VLHERPGAQALLAGVGPMRPRLEEQIGALGLGDRIRLLGPRSDVDALMSIASLFLLTSRFEGMPNVVMEAESIGIPVIATAAGATPQLVQHGRTGFVHPIGDVEGLAQSCLQLLADPVKASEMGKAGRRLMQTRYNKQRLGERYVALLNSSAPQAPQEAADVEASQAWSTPARVATIAR
jgi:glycosyltransferase involved in cell wall biosynthesis